MSYKRQITSGVITKMERKELYFLVTAETDHDGAHYITTLRVGVTNYPLAVGDILCWSCFFNGFGSTDLWWRRAEIRYHLCKLWLHGVESQKIVPL
jgi:hypothetical protein